MVQQKSDVPDQQVSYRTQQDSRWRWNRQSICSVVWSHGSNLLTDKQRQGGREFPFKFNALYSSVMKNSTTLLCSGWYQDKVWEWEARRWTPLRRPWRKAASPLKLPWTRVPSPFRRRWRLDHRQPRGHQSIPGCGSRAWPLAWSWPQSR